MAEPAPSTLPGAERLFERLLDRLPSGVVVVDRELRVAYANSAARQLLGGGSALRAGEPLPNAWADYGLRGHAESLFTEATPGSHLVETGERVLCVDGLSSEDGSTATLLLEDVTERERTRRGERQFVENAAHELRTPLAAIVSVVDVLDGGAKEDPATRDRFLAHIRAHSDRLVRLATSLLTLARVQSGRERPRLDLVAVEPFLQELANRLEPAAGVDIEVQAAEGIGVLADPDLLYRALENVAANAIEHTREGRVVLRARELGRRAEIEITDTGIGMTRNDVHHAFDRFYRAARDRNGFGLGLSIAAEAVRVLGGTIELDSAPNAGTCVRIELPSARIVTR